MAEGGGMRGQAAPRMGRGHRQKMSERPQSRRLSQRHKSRRHQNAILKLADVRSHHTALTPTTKAKWAVSRPSPRVPPPPPSRRAAPLPSCRQSSRLSTTTRYCTKDAALCGDLRRLAPNARREAGDAQLLTGAAKPPPHNPWERPLSSSRGSEVKPPIGRLGLKEDFPSTAVQRP